ncbi:MAG: alpha/beta fold hydrolase [Desulfamplus sp.]|nr:alpha/beta fold hydrolase [Desulfamplus sp.]
MKSIENIIKLKRSVTRLIVNDIPARIINAGYNTYSKIYQGQLSLGLPVSRELVHSHREMKINAVGKLALSLYHIFKHATGETIPRDQIKAVIGEDLAKGRIKLTENVILLNIKSLTYLTLRRFHIDQSFLQPILDEAGRRYILKESFKLDRQPVYFESEINERESNGRGDYATVFYRTFTEEGKEIRFQRLASMEDVTAGDSRPSVVLVPGFANNSNCFNLSNHYSMSMDLADASMWVYMFDPRGMGINNGRFDPYYTVDTLIDYDLPAVLKFSYTKSCGKPSVLVGHSMGGMVSESMVLNWGLSLNYEKLNFLSSKEKRSLAKVLPSKTEAKNNIKMVKAIISLGSPKFFDKTSHVFFPAALWLNHLTRILRLSYLPVQEVSRVVTDLPIIKDITRLIYNNNIGELNFLIEPENHKDDKFFIERYLKTATESIPLGIGFQLLRSVYDETGFKRMDNSNLNYSDCFAFFPEEIPLFHFWGSKDHLAPVDNIKYSQFYPHKHKKVYRIDSVDDLKKVEITDEKSQLIDFVIEGASHIDLLYGKIAREILYPLYEQIIETVWGGWTYEQSPLKSCDNSFFELPQESIDKPLRDKLIEVPAQSELSKVLHQLSEKMLLELPEEPDEKLSPLDLIEVNSLPPDKIDRRRGTSNVVSKIIESADKARNQIESADKARNQIEPADKARNQIEPADKACDQIEPADKARNQIEPADKACDQIEPTTLNQSDPADERTNTFQLPEKVNGDSFKFDKTSITPRSPDKINDVFRGNDNIRSIFKSQNKIETDTCDNDRIFKLC